ncbi:ricin B-like lectin R40G3 isoform X2 [Andrographis paniculata]|uniref:ricin B-like lectin R40G3 isoform X2 n=1 Tax=Andrographis paniculata TaxID=175694 RepID=UPI0021E8EF97|nr:ricin B-like lectin R40G3 isoform X2 [Andrographis paniculata]
MDRRHHHHDRRDDRPEYPPPPPFQEPPPPPFYGRDNHGPRREEYPAPPPAYGHQPEVFHTSHQGPRREEYPAPPPPSNFSSYPGGPPPPPAVDHRPHFPGHREDPHGGLSEFANKPTYRMYCKAGSNFSLAIRDGRVILTRHNPSDPHQHWYKDEKFSTRVKDEEGFPSFALVNKATGQAIKHAAGPSHPVQLIHHNSDRMDESILWTESKDTGENYRAIRMVNNIKLNVDAWHGDKDHGGVREGTTISLWDWTKGDNQRWKLVPY